MFEHQSLIEIELENTPTWKKYGITGVIRITKNRIIHKVHTAGIESASQPTRLV